jgi:alpha/beta hydrolase family protein
VPRIADGSLVPPDRTGFPAVPGIAVVREVNAVVRVKDWVHPKPEGGKQYLPLVARVGADGNEIAGLRLPDIAVPRATYTGWNAYKAPFPEGEICDRDGSYAPLPQTKAERLAGADPRPSLEDLYGTPARYVAAVSAAAQALVKDRLLLPEDAERYIAAATAATAF